MYSIFTEIFTRPLLNLLVFFYQTLPFHDLGLSIILVTILIRLLLYPFVAKSLRTQKALSDIQPEIKALQEKYKNNKEEQAKQTMELYRTRGVNPFSGCLPVLVQLPLLIGLVSVFSAITEPGALDQLYGFVARPNTINTVAFGFLNLATPNVMLAIMAGATQFLQAYFAPQPVTAGGDSPFAKSMQTQTLYFLPIFITVIAWRFAAALPLYWVVLNIIGIFQQGGIPKDFLRRRKPH